MVRKPLRRVAYGLLGALLAVMAWAQTPPPDGIIDLGKRQIGATYPFTLVAQNINCDQPQDFRFVVAPNPWLSIEGDPVARGIERGQSRTVRAKIDVSRIPPGKYNAQVTVVCDTCQFLVFANCKVSDRQIVLRVEATRPPPPPAQPAAPTKPAARPRPATPPTAREATFDPVLTPWLSPASKRAADDAQRKADEAAAAARKAADDLEGIRKKKGPCEEELAKLEAEADAAIAAAEAARTAAGEAAGKAAAADQAAAGNAQALADAEKAMKDADERLRNAAAARSQLRRDGANASAMTAAQAIVDKANDDAHAAQKAYLAARAAAQPLLDAAATAKAEAEAANAAAEAAEAKAAEAEAAADAKRAECFGLAQAESEAQQKADAAAGAADDAAGAAAAARKKAEDDARAAAILSLEEELDRKRRQCREIYETQLANAKKQEKALQGLKQIGALDPATPTDGLDEMWNEWGQWASGLVTDAGAVAGGFSAGGKPIPTGAGPQMILSVLQAAYGIFQIRIATLTPNTKAYLTDREVNGDQSQANELLRSKEIAASNEEAEEVLDEMERILDNPDVMAEDMARAMDQFQRCEEEVKALEAKLAAAKG